MERLNEAQRGRLDDFLKQQQERAYRMAYVMTRNRDDALELVQDAMTRLVQHYADKPAEQWTLLFFRILQNRVRDFHRRQTVRRLFGLLPGHTPDVEAHEHSHLPAGNNNGPAQTLEQDAGVRRIIDAIQDLPLRQQQAFVLRAWQEFSVEETASLMSVSTGSVKTHYRRALDKLRVQLENPDERF